MKAKTNDLLTHKIIGCAMRVHRTIGCGFQEVIYQKALAIELEDQGIGFMREVPISIFYKEVEIGARRVDFLIENHVLLELKAVTTLEDVHLAQALNYLEAFSLKKGILINFGARSLQFKRLIRQNHDCTGFLGFARLSEEYVYCYLIIKKPQKTTYGNHENQS